MNGIFERKPYFQLSGTTVRGLRGYIPMFHHHGELVYVARGSICITVDGESYTLKAGELAILFPFLTHSYQDAPDAEVTLLLFDPAATAFDNTLLGKKPVCCRVEGNGISPMLQRAVTMLRSGRRKTAMGYLNAILGELLELLQLEDRDPVSGNVTLQLLLYCEEHFTQDITVQRIADALYISPSYVSKIFAQKLHYSFREYINALRVHKAQALLKETDKKVLQIMTECGFRNQSSFNRVFQQAIGISPREYRKTVRTESIKVQNI